MSEAVNVDALLAKLEKRRRLWVDLDSGRRLQLQRPTEVQMAMAASMARPELVAFYCSLAVDWEGFTAADLGGTADMALPFSQRAWAAIWPDHIEWVAKVCEEAAAAFRAHQADREAAAKN